MHVEVSVALNFVISYLYNKLPRRRVNMMAVELEKGLKKKFEGHWYPDKPFKGSGFRSLPVTGSKVDPVIEISAFESGLDIDEVRCCLPTELTLWIDPQEVSYRIGEKGVVKVLYSARRDISIISPEEIQETPTDREIQSVSRGFNPEAQCFKPIDSLSSSLSSLSLSPSSPTPPSSVNNNSWSNSNSPSTSLFNSVSPVSAPKMPSFYGKGSGIAPQFTTATFAQTKFGSTKLKMHVKRPNRLSPTEFAFRQRSATIQNVAGFVSSPGQTAAPPATRPRSLSPRDPRVEFIMDQHQRIAMVGATSPQSEQLPSPIYQPSELSPLNHQQPPQQHVAHTFPANQALFSGSPSGFPASNTTPDQLNQISPFNQFPSPTSQMALHSLGSPSSLSPGSSFRQQQHQQQQQQQQQHQQQHPQGYGMLDHVVTPTVESGSTGLPYASPLSSPDSNRSFLDGINLNQMSSYQNQYHQLLLAN